MKQLTILVLFLIAIIVNQSMAQSVLSSNIMRRVNAANLELDQAEEQIRTGKAEHAPRKLKTARKEYDDIFNYYKGSFDPNHPILIKLKNRIESIEQQLSENSPKPKVEITKNTGNTKELSANIKRRIIEADIKLDFVNKSAAKGNRATDALNAAKAGYHSIFEYYEGRFDPKHSDIIAFKKRIDQAEKAMNAGFAKKNATAPLESNPAAVEDLPKKMGEALIDIALAISRLENRLDTASKSTSPESYVYGVNDDLNIALGEYKRFNADYKGQFDPTHVAYLQVQKRIEKGKTAVSELEVRAGSK